MALGACTRDDGIGMQDVLSPTSLETHSLASQHAQQASDPRRLSSMHTEASLADILLQCISDLSAEPSPQTVLGTGGQQVQSMVDEKQGAQQQEGDCAMDNWLTQHLTHDPESFWSSLASDLMQG
jgi:hypothetical protein